MPSNSTHSLEDLEHTERIGWLHQLVVLAVRHPTAVIGMWSLVAVFGCIGASRLNVDTGTASFFDRSATAWSQYQSSLQLFGGDEIVVVAIEGSVAFDPATLDTVIDLTNRFADLPGVRRVDSVSTVAVIHATKDGSLSLRPPLSPRSTDSEDRELTLRRLLEFDRIAPRNLVSADHRVFAINVILDEDVDRHRESIVSEIRRATEGLPAWVSGVPVFRTDVNFETIEELKIFVPLTILLVGCVVFYASRRLAAVTISLGTSGLGTVVMLGAMGAVGTPISLSTMILPSIMLALGCAYVMHIIAAGGDEQSLGGIKRGVLGVTHPVALSGLTTAVGFLSMSLVRIGAIRELGVFGSIGVLSILVASLTFSPALMSIFPRKGQAIFRAHNIVRYSRTHVVAFALKNSRLIIGIWALLAAVSSFGVIQLRVETDIIQWFSERSPIRSSYERIRTSLSGITPVNVVIESVSGRVVTSPDLVATVDRLAHYLEILPAVGRSISVVDPLIQIHSGFRPERSGELPSKQSEISQYLFLLSSLEQMGDVISPDHLSTNVLLRLNHNGSREIVELSQRIDEWWRDLGVPGFTAKLTGVMYEFARAEEEIAHGQLRGLGVAFLVIAVILLLIFRTPRIAVMALIPNATPLLITYGFMGAFDIPLDAATICLGSLALGIAVDDTIHVTHGFSAAIRSGHSVEASVELAITDVVAPLVFSTVAVSVGFAVLGLSDFTLIQHLGILTSVMVLVCLVADLTLLPALLVEFSSDRREEIDRPSVD